MDAHIRAAVSTHGRKYPVGHSPCPPFRWTIARSNFVGAVEMANSAIGENRSGLVSPVRYRAQTHVEHAGSRANFHIGDMYTVLWNLYCDPFVLPNRARLKQFDGLVQPARQRRTPAADRGTLNYYLNNEVTHDVVLVMFS